jgi:hypothetical protein
MEALFFPHISLRQMWATRRKITRWEPLFGRALFFPHISLRQMWATREKCHSMGEIRIELTA